MKIQDLMTRTVEPCRRNDDLAAVAMIMWRRDCGIVPVVEEDGKLLGVITDRDICMATATRHLSPEQLTASDVMTTHLYLARPDDDPRSALELMRRSRVRRLPVVDGEKNLVGMVSINDLILHAEPSAGRSTGHVPAIEVLETLKGICSHPKAVRKPARVQEHELVA